MALQPSMLGKRTRGNTPADIQQVKRPLTALVGPTSTKPSLGNTPAKRVAAGPPVMQRTLSQKENQAVQPIVAPEQDDVFMATPSEDKPSAGAYSQFPEISLAAESILILVPTPQQLCLHLRVSHAPTSRTRSRSHRRTGLFPMSTPMPHRSFPPRPTSPRRYRSRDVPTSAKPSSPSCSAGSPQPMRHLRVRPRLLLVLVPPRCMSRARPASARLPCSRPS